MNAGSVKSPKPVGETKPRYCLLQREESAMTAVLIVSQPGKGKAGVVIEILRFDLKQIF